MTEPTCGVFTREGICGKPAAVRSGQSGRWFCPREITLAPGYHLLSDAQLLSIIGEVVAAAEDECRTGHAWKQDEVTLGVWQTLLRRMAEVGK